MQMISAIFKLLGIILFGAIVVAFVAFFGTWFLMALIATVVILALAWMIGVPIAITRNGKKIGYVRWTKFYPTK